MPSSWDRRDILTGLGLAAATGVAAGGSEAAEPAVDGAPVRVKRAYFDGRFGQVHYRIAQPAGRSTKPPLLLLHQSPTGSGWWEIFMAQAGKDRLVLAPDNPGYGESDPPPKQPDIEDFAASAGDLLDLMQVRAFDVMGYHTGSTVAVELARQRKATVRKVILVSAAVMTPEDVAELGWLLKPTDVREDGAQMLTVWKGLMAWKGPGWTKEMVYTQFPDYLRRPQTSYWAFDAVFRYPLLQRVEDITQPLMLLVPDDDLTQKTARIIPHLKNGVVLPLPGWGPGFLDVWPVQSAAVVRGFLDEGVARPPLS